MAFTLALVSCQTGCPPSEDLPEYDPEEEQVTIAATDGATITVPIPRISWPFAPTDQFHPLLSQYGQYMQTGTETPRLHHGIDVLAPGTEVADRLRVYAVASGFVTYIYHGGTYDSRLGVGKSYGNGEGHIYVHLDHGSLPAWEAGKRVEKGSYIGDAIEWNDTAHTHVHLEHVWGSGMDDPVLEGDQWTGFESLDSPLPSLDPNEDPVDPELPAVAAGEQFRFCVNETSDYFPVDSAGHVTVKGKVDVVARFFDKASTTVDWELGSYVVELKIVRDSDDTLVLTRRTHFENGLKLEPGLMPPVHFKDDTAMSSKGSYTDREFYVVATNSDEDSVLLEKADAVACWDTTLFSNGKYTVTVRVSDLSRDAEASMDVVVGN